MSLPARAATSEATLLSLTLYVAGDNTFSRRARANLEGIVADMGIVTSVVIIDVLANPELTLTKRIFVTPSLIIRYDIGPEMLIVGDLTDRRKVTTTLCNAQSGLP